MRRGQGKTRGMALIQSLVIVAAIAAVSAALLLRADTARQRLQTRFDGDQLALHLDSGVALIGALIRSLPEKGPLHRGQEWAQPRSGILIDNGVLAWQVDDLQSRFNVNTLNGSEPEHAAAREAFLRLAADHGINRVNARRLADALGADLEARAEATGGAPLPLPLIDPRQLAPLAQAESTDLAAFLAVLSALPAATPMTINTLDPTVLRALLPDVSSTAVNALERRLRRDPAESMEALFEWAEEALGAEISERLASLPLEVSSDWFIARVDAQLDTLHMRRSVVLNRDGAQGRSAVYLSMPEPNY